MRRRRFIPRPTRTSCGNRRQPRFTGYTAPLSQRGDLDKIFALYLESLGGTALLVKLNPYFTLRSLDVRRMARLLVEQDNALIAYCRQQFRPCTRNLLHRFDVRHMRFQPADILPGFALALLLGHTDIAIHVRERLSPVTRQRLSAYDGGDSLELGLQSALADDLNERVLRDLSLFRNQWKAFRKLDLPVTAIALANSIYLEFLRDRYTAEQEPSLASLRQVEPAETPVADDLIRLNRLLLEAAFPYGERQPWGFRPSNIPTLNEVREALAGRRGDVKGEGEFNRLLDDPQLYTEERFPGLADDYPSLLQRYANQTVWLNRDLLESAFPSEIEPSHAPYRERLTGLIAVLRRGASTRQGIIDIVAANLGIVGDEPQAQAAKSLIQLEEFNPERSKFFAGPLSLYQEFEVENTNPDDATPEIWLKMRPGETRILCNIRFEDRVSHQSIQVGTRIQAGDSLTFKDGVVLLNGLVAKELPVGSIPTLKPGKSQWRFEADLIALDDGSTQPAGRIDQVNYGQSVWVNGAAVADVQVLSYRYTTGTFTVVIPWHIEGFTDKFEETGQHPRHQILALVNRVKAAGIQAGVAYRQVFREDHELLESLNLQIRGGLLTTDHASEDDLFISNIQHTLEDQDISDSLSLSGRFDLTRWDSLNTFSR